MYRTNADLPMPGFLLFSPCLPAQDSLWAAEDIDAVFDADPQRVCILQGPVAVKYCTRTDEPIGEMLGGIESNLAKKLLDRYYNGDESKVPRVDYLGAKQPARVELRGVEVTQEGQQTTYQFGDASTLPAVEPWLETLAGPKVDWLRALLTTNNIIQGTSYVSNPMVRLFQPRPNQRVVATTDATTGEATSVVFYGGARSFGPHPADFKAVELTFNASKNLISLTMFEERDGSSLPLVFYFNYRPDMGFAPIHEVVEGRNDAIKAFYWKLWFGDNEEIPELELKVRFRIFFKRTECQKIAKSGCLLPTHSFP